MQPPTYLRRALIILLLLVSCTETAEPGLEPTVATDLAPASFTSTLAASHSGRCLDVPEGKTANGVLLQQWDCRNNANQRFDFHPVAGKRDTYVIRNPKTRGCVDVSLSKKSEQGAFVLHQWACHGLANQQFQLKSAGATTFELVAQHTGTCADVARRAKGNGATLHAWRCQGGANQQWKIAGIGGAPPSPDPGGDTPAVWRQFVEAKRSGKEPVLPDFSYAGYHYSEKAIPDVKGPVFDITEYGAKPDDAADDRDGIQAAIGAAQRAGGGIVFFPRGRFLLNERGPSQKNIQIKGSNIVLRGSGSGAGGTELFMRSYLAPKNPEKFWTVPPMFEAVGASVSFLGERVTTVAASSARESFSVTVADTSRLKAGDWIILYLKDARAAAGAVAPYSVEPQWNKLKSGELAQERHQIARIEGKRLVLREPLHMDVNAKYTWEVRKTRVGEEFGVEDLAFVGNFKEKFQHFKNAQHNSGWSMLKIEKYANSWARRLRFKDVSSALSIKTSSAITVANIVLEGNPGHNSLGVQGSYGVLVSKLVDRAGTGNWHGPGISNYAAGTVFHRNSWPAEVTFDAHGGFPYATLYDGARGGLVSAKSGSGGSQGNIPNHMRHLVFWNFQELGPGGKNYRFWRTESKYGRFVLPLFVGYRGPSSFDAKQLQLNESFGKAVSPASLFESQLELRLGKRPTWLE